MSLNANAEQTIFRACVNWCLIALCLFVVVLAAVSDAVAADPEFPKLSGRVVDEANVLSDADKQRIVAKLAAWEKNSTDQIVVVTVGSLRGRPIEDYGVRLARHWGIGQAGEDNGV